MKTKKNKSVMEQLREIRDRISLETMDMNFDELKHYFDERRKKTEQRSKSKHSPSIAAEPNAKYSKR